MNCKQGNMERVRGGGVVGKLEKVNVWAEESDIDWKERGREREGKCVSSLSKVCVHSLPLYRAEVFDLPRPAPQCN